MRKRPRTAGPIAEHGTLEQGVPGLDGADDLRYCVLCESSMLFELVDAAGEWICVRCGSAVFVDPPAPGARRTA